MTDPESKESHDVRPVDDVKSLVYRVDVTITAPVNPTEVTDRVVNAVQNIFPSSTIEHNEDTVIAESHNLDKFSELIHRRSILDTTRSELFARRRDSTLSFSLKKQAAFQGVVNFAVGAPSELGDITVEVTVHEPDVETFIDHIAPPTEDGVPIDPNRRDRM